MYNAGSCLKHLMQNQKGDKVLNETFVVHTRMLSQLYINAKCLLLPSADHGDCCFSLLKHGPSNNRTYTFKKLEKYVKLA